MKWIITFLTIGLILRIYHLPERFLYAHDADLYSWIVKDILVDHHLRLIGQLTSTPGIFIGALFYYALVPFYWLTNMEPTGAMILGVVLSVLTAVSVYFVLSRLFNKTAGLIALFLQSVLLLQIGYDIWVVPTVTTSLWSIWYLYVVVMISRGNYKVLPILGLLIALIWHVSFALTPVLLTLPVAVILSRKLPTFRQLMVGCLVLIISSVPLLLFESRHGWSQTQSFLQSFGGGQGEAAGLEKLQHVLYQIGTNVSPVLFFPYRDFILPRLAHLTLYIIFGLVLIKAKVLPRRSAILFLSWFAGIVLFFSLSSKIISEYYFSSINTIALVLLALGLSYLWQKNSVTRKVCLIICAALLSWSSYYIFSGQTDDPYGYLPKNNLVSYLANDARNNNYPCIGLSYIKPAGEIVGLRYLIYLEDLKIKQPDQNTPIYSVVYPLSWAEEASKHRFGSLGVIPEQHQLTAEQIEQGCAGDNVNLTDSLFGYTE